MGLMWAMVACVLMAAGQSAGFGVEGISSVVIPVTVGKMTNLVFPEAVQVGVKVSMDIMAQKVKGVENVIELKAARRDFPATNLSVYGKDGRLYSFVLRYVADTPVLNFRVVAGSSATAVMLAGLPVSLGVLRADAYVLAGRRRFLRVVASGDGLRLRLTGIYLKDSLQWLVMRLKNRSASGFCPGYARVYVQDKQPVQRRAQQDRVLAPVYDGMPGTVAGASAVQFAVGLRPFSVGKGKRLVVELAGTDGRTVLLKVKGRVVAKGRAG